MKDMFYNYDHDINKKEYPEILDFSDHPKDMTNYGDIMIIKDIKENIIGVSVCKGSPIKLYFHLDGTIGGSDDLEKYINSVTFNILDLNHEVLITKTPNFVNKDLYIEISSEENILKQDLYRMQLIADIDEDQYTLFSEQDAVLEIR